MKQVVYTFEPIFDSEDYVKSNSERIVKYYRERLIALKRAMDDGIITNQHFVYELGMIRQETRRHPGLNKKVFCSEIWLKINARRPLVSSGTLTSAQIDFAKTD
ncbi:MAG: hypothetical protein HOJ16_07750 [Candidatus Peribacter sp.]|jgi:hypothetical protein|nr:hypothetical protein [Candidatus Peribacter sp.]